MNKRKSEEALASTSTKKSHSKNSNDDLTEEVEEGDICCNSKTVKMGKYKDVFRYTANKNSKKIGVCLLCEKNGSCVEILRTNGSTNGMKNHLQTNHRDIFQRMFPDEIKLQANQKTIQQCLAIKKEDVNMDRVTVCWLAYKNLPFNFLDDSVTQNFFGIINNNLKLPKKTSMHEKVIKEFKEMQGNLKEILQKNESKLSYTVDAWFGRNGKSYYGVTVHFIDDDWRLHSIALDLLESKGKHKGSDIAELFLNTVISFGVQDKIQGITLDNASANDTFVKELSTLLQKEGVSFDSHNQRFRCLAHILNLGIQDVLKMINLNSQSKLKSIFDITTDDQLIEEPCSDTDDSDEEENDQGVSSIISKLRYTIRKIRKSEVLANRLESFCTALNIKFLRPILDVSTRWNSTADMLETAYNAKLAYNMLWLNCPEIQKYKLDDSDWDILQQLLRYLQFFKQASAIVSKEKEASMPPAVIVFNLLLDQIEKIIFSLQDKINQSCSKNRTECTDEKLLLAFQAGLDKLAKHYRNCNWIYSLCLIFDPRHKYKGFDETPWGRELKQESTKLFENIFKTDYFEKLSKVDDEKSFESIEKLGEDYLNLNSVYRTDETSDVNWRREIIEYISAPRASRDTIILEWWKSNAHIFPTLSKMARDYLCIMPSSVPVERLFSEASGILTLKRCSMKYDSLRALLCIHSWMISSLKNRICQISI